MGNLLGAPVTEKETHEGTITSENIPYGVTSMQGWRVHMEDAHITENRLHASEAVVNGSNKTYKKLPLPGHALFAVFDGHGGTFAAAYAGRNLCRVLSRQPKFIEYAKFEQERPSKEKTITDNAERNNYIRSGLELLEAALCDSFVEVDREIALALKGTKVPDADQPYQDEDEAATAAGSSGTGANANKDDDKNAADDADAMNTSQSAGMNHAAEDGGQHNMQGVTHDENPADSALQLLEEEGDSGTTACVVVLTPGFVVCANAGDSRAVISRLGNKAVPLSFDHKPEDEEEENRIRAAGGYVAGGRVEGDLAVSRGLGDFRFKNMDVVMAATSQRDQPPSPEEPQQHVVMMKPGDQKVSPIPDIVVQSRNEEQDEFVMIACDGIWDVQTNYEAVQTVAEMFKEGETNLGLICEEVCDICLSMGSKDNMTSLIIKFPAQKVSDGGGVQARRQLRNAAATATDDENQDEGENPAADGS